MPASGSSYAQARKLSGAKAKEVNIISEYKLGYRNREDITNTTPGVLIVGSQNVIVNISDRIQIRQGYSLDGATSVVAAPILGAFDFFANYGERNLRAGFLTTAGNDGKLQYRYVDSSGNVTWEDLITGVTNVNYNFCTFWNTTELTRETLFVNGQSQIQSWNGAIATFASATNTTGYITELDPTPTNAGTGYVVGDILTITTGGSTATAKVTGVTGSNSGAIVSLVIPDVYKGQNYIVGDVVIVPSGTGGTLTVTSVDSGGGVTGLAITTVGSGYSGTYYFPTGGHGTNLGIFVTGLGGQSISSVALLTNGAGYSTGTGKTTTGGSGTGATLKIDSVGTGSITIQETDPITLLGFYLTTNMNILLGGVTYSYASVLGNTFYGISPDATTPSFPAGTLITQAVVTTPNASITGLLNANFQESLISNLNNQIYLGALNSSQFYISKVGSYKDYSFSSPRVTGEGWTQSLDTNLVAFTPQENYMYISCGTDLWYNVAFQAITSTVGISYEQVNATPLTTGRQQGAMSQAFVSHMKNDILLVTNEPTIDTFGRLATSLATPQQTNLSDPIKLDVDSYDFTDGSIFYYKYNIYLTVPKEGLVLIYSLATKSWQAPQTLPISRFYIVDGQLYGHSYQTSESYQLFTGYADRVYPGFLGYPIDAKWIFAYQNFGTRTYLKSANYFYIEGYINTNTIATATLTYELSNPTIKNFTIDGSNALIAPTTTGLGSLGKMSLGKQKLGGTGADTIDALPNKFRVEKSFTNTDFFEISVSFEVLGVNQRMEILAFGLNAIPSTQNPVSIRQS